MLKLNRGSAENLVVFSQTHNSKSQKPDAAELCCTSSLLFNSSNQPAHIHLFHYWEKTLH